MSKDLHDIAIIGAGPIGAATAYFLSQSKKSKNKKIILISQDPNNDPKHEATYLYAGGCVQYSFWSEDTLMGKMTRATANFVLEKEKEGEDFSVIDTHYLRLYTGVVAPSLNISGAKLVNYLLEQSIKNGIEHRSNTSLKKITKDKNQYLLNTSNGDIIAKKVFLAVGPNVNKFIPEAKVKFEKRVNLMFDTKVEENMMGWPHVVAGLNKGWVFVFRKKVGDQFKIILGQEEAVHHSNTLKEENYFPKLLKMGLGKIFPFIEKANVEKIFWGFDAVETEPQIYSKGNLMAANCGSAVRTCVYIGKLMADKLTSE